MTIKEFFKALQPFIRQDVDIAVTENVYENQIVGVAVVLPDHILSQGVQTLCEDTDNGLAKWKDIDGEPHWSGGSGECTGSYRTYWLQKKPDAAKLTTAIKNFTEPAPMNDVVGCEFCRPTGVGNDADPFMNRPLGAAWTCPYCSTSYDGSEVD